MKVSPDYFQLSRELKCRLETKDTQDEDEVGIYLKKLSLWELKNWVVATDGNVEQALELLKASTRWRLNEKIDNLLEWIPSQHLVRDYPIEFAGVDRDGSPLWVVPFGKCNVRKILEHTSPEDFIRYTLKVIEMSLHLVRLHYKQEEQHLSDGTCKGHNQRFTRSFKSPDVEGNQHHPVAPTDTKAESGTQGRGRAVQWIQTGNSVDPHGLGGGSNLHLVQESDSEDEDEHGASLSYTSGQVVIFDLEGLTLSQVRDRQTLEVITKLASLYEANYPETLKCAIVLNANWLFQLLFSVVKRFVAKKTIQKVVVLGTETHEWRLELAKRLPKHILPVRYGGSKRKTMTVVEMSNLLVEKPNDTQLRTGMRKQSSVNNLVSPAFQTLNPPNERLNLCRQKIHPQCNLSLKFNVAKDKTDLEWCLRTEKGDILFAIYRRAMVEQITFKDRVSEVSVTTPLVSQAKDPLGDDMGALPKETDVDAINLAVDHHHHHHPGQENGDVSSVITVFEEVEEDAGQSEDISSEVEVIEPPKKIVSNKSFTRGRIKCDRGYTYSVVMENTSTLFPSKTIDYQIHLIRRSSEIEEIDAHSNSSIEETESERNAKIDDLLHFVHEITNSDNQGTKTTAFRSSANETKNAKPSSQK
ncbi:hypothetical protein TCAL_10859 [Tigriopus californicus]|uniref:CRAL-TRIO domain-containing protein n=1 Tax=Tigriopus californicus TaxID=6832 RepID=A0A553P4J4_TIGCA|nr:uncharacterized protein LOC131883911 [Tigriopus californicus]TRY72593.1 hypothetical protein TCAL_10859 [Tigriopus californicus]